MAEQKIGEYDECLREARPWRKNFMIAKIGGGARHATAAAQGLRHERGKPFFIGLDQGETRDASRQNCQKGNQNMPPAGTHSPRKACAEKPPQTLHNPKPPPLTKQTDPAP